MEDIERKYKHLEKRYNKLHRLFYILLVISALAIILFGGMSIFYQYAYHEAIRYGAESTVTAIELVAACQSLGNFTETQLKEQYFRMFILNRTSG
jgi:thiosulfate reductase cytochrome b subunit